MQAWEKQSLFALNVAALLKHINESGMLVTLGEAYRTPEQAEIYAKEGKGIVDSLHCKRLAIDINLLDKCGTYITDVKEYEPFGVFWESLHKFNRWGGRFKTRVDADHFETQDL